MGRKERRASAAHARRSRFCVGPEPALNVDQITDLLAVATACYGNRDFAEARTHCRAILERDPQHVPSLILLGDMAQQDGSNNKAIRFLNRALAIDPQNAAAHDNIAIAYRTIGRHEKAVGHFSRAILLGLSDPELLVKQRPAVAALLQGCLNGQRQLPDWSDTESVESIARGAPLLLAIMQSRPVFDAELERLLTALRRNLLRRATGFGPNELTPDEVKFYCALAQQCFINEYIFTIDDGEWEQSQKISERISKALESGGIISVLDLIVSASYLPLHDLPMAPSLLDRTWPNSIDRLLAQQVCEPLEEKRDSDKIPTITAIDDAISLKVQEQYEENPYPRWIATPSVRPTTIANYLADTIGIASAALPSTINDILIAGCGTGSHSIQTAQLFPEANILAVDISRASLSYARRKTRAAALSNIEYAQADILKLASLQREFGLIEAVGVLHHLHDPWTGWRVLLSLLRPRGLMFVGLYSKLARRSVTEARNFIAERGYRPTVRDIRLCRQSLIARARVPNFKDFWSTSGCRDLLFNVMEHQFTIPQIKAFLDANELEFLGFEQLPSGVLEQFQHQFPSAAARQDLAAWHAFEQAHPHTFGNMYMFWMQKK